MQRFLTSKNSVHTGLGRALLVPLCLLLCMITLDGSLVAHANSPRINLIDQTENNNDFYSGSWVATGNHPKIEVFIWWVGKHRNFNNKNSPKIDRWRALVYQGNGKTSLFDGFDVPKRRIQMLSELGGEFGVFDLKPRSIDSFTLVAETWMREDTPLQKAIAATKGRLIFKRKSISDEFAKQVNIVQASWKSGVMLPTPLAIHRAETPNYKLDKHESDFVTLFNQAEESQIDEISIAEISLRELRSHQQYCGWFSEQDSYTLSERLGTKDHKERYIFVIEEKGVRALMPNKSQHPLPIRLSLADEELDIPVLCNNTSKQKKANEKSGCPLCFYPAGRYLDALYHQDKENLYDISNRYMRSHKGRSKSDKKYLFEVFSQGVINSVKERSLLEEVIGFYMLKYTNSPLACFKPGAIQRSKTVNFSGYALQDGYGYTVLEVEPTQITETYRINNEFSVACGNLCNAHGALILDVITDPMSDINEYNKAERRLVLDVFASLDQMMHEYSCNSTVRKTFEKSLLALYRDRDSFLH